MSTSVVTVTPDFTSVDQKTIDLYGTIAVGAGDYVAGGLSCNFASMVVASGAPIKVDFYSVKNNGAAQSPPVDAFGPASLYDYHYVPGENPGDGVFQVFVQAAAAGDAKAELAATTTPAGVTGDAIAFKATWLRQ